MLSDRIIVSDFIAQIGARIRFLRLERGLTLWKLARMAESNSDSIEQIELGRSAIQMKTLCKLSKALNVQPWDILNHDTDTSDVGCILEMLRQHPVLVRPTIERINGCLGKAR